jgi:hypothetical protein
MNDTTCGCRTDRTLDQLLMDYILFGDQTAGAELVARADEFRSVNRLVRVEDGDSTSLVPAVGDPSGPVPARQV